MVRERRVDEKKKRREEGKENTRRGKGLGFRI